jgi:hypothetical protein
LKSTDVSEEDVASLFRAVLTTCFTPVFLLGVFVLEGGGDIFFRKFGRRLKDYTALYVFQKTELY